MTDTTVADAAAGADAHPSQVIEHVETHENPRPGTMPEVEQPKEPAKPLSTREAIAKAFDEANPTKTDKVAKVEAKEVIDDKSKPDAKPDEAKAKAKAKASRADGEPVKAENAEDATPVKAEHKGAPDEAAAGQEGSERSRQSEGRQHHEPPARFLPEARAKWANVPNEVKAEFHRVSREFEQEVEQYRGSHEEWKRLERFDQLAKTHGTSVEKALDRYVELDRMLQTNPVAAIREILSSRGVTVEQFARHVLENPEAHQAPQGQPARAAAPTPDPKVTYLEQRLHDLEGRLAEAAAAPIIQNFASLHPDYQVLEPKIGEILASGIIEKLYGPDLAPDQKLTEAYRMAGGTLPPSRSEPELVQSHSGAAHVPSNDAGTKSIRGAPTSGQTGEPKWVPKSNREALERAFASAR